MRFSQGERKESGTVNGELIEKRCENSLRKLIDLIPKKKNKLLCYYDIERYKDIFV